jgi:hypothetical protein
MSDELRDDDAGGQRGPGPGQLNPADHAVTMPGRIPGGLDPNGRAGYLSHQVVSTAGRAEPGPFISSHAISRSSAAWRLKRLLIKKHGRYLRAGQADRWTEEWLHGLGLQKLSGTIPYPKAAYPCQEDRR